MSNCSIDNSSDCIHSNICSESHVNLKVKYSVSVLVLFCRMFKNVLPVI